MDGHYVLCRVCRVFGLGMTTWFSVLLVGCCVVQYVFALDFRFVLAFVFSALLVAAVALIEERIEDKFYSMDVR
jgi:hypothetical protein